MRESLVKMIAASLKTRSYTERLVLIQDAFDKGLDVGVAVSTVALDLSIKEGGVLSEDIAPIALPHLKDKDAAR